jgi:CoA-binding domain
MSSPTYGFEWYYFVAIGLIATISVLAFQAADIYHVHAFRSPVGQIVRLLPAWTIVFAIALAIAFFAKFEGDVLAALAGGGLLQLVGFRLILSCLVRHWTNEGRLERRAVVVGGAG